MSKSGKRFIAAFFLIVAILSFLSAQSVWEKGGIVTEITGLENNVYMTKYGNLKTKLDGQAFMDLGFEWGDIINVSFRGYNLSLPFIPNFSYVESGTAAVRVERDTSGIPEGVVVLGINMGDFTNAYKIATKTTNEDGSWFWTAYDDVEFPFQIVFSMGEKQGYLSEYLVHDLVISNERSDYPNLTDEQYANFRKIETTGVHGNLYRSSNPVNAKNNRNVQADDACRSHGIDIALNLSDGKAEAEERTEYQGSYYSTIKVKYLALGMDFESELVRAGLADGLRFLAENKGTYLINCNEGKDRSGFVCAVLECLMGATADEVIDDYMQSYYNLYGVEKGSPKYDAIVESNLIKTLGKAFGFDDIHTADLAKLAENYILSLGLTPGEIEKLKSNL